MLVTGLVGQVVLASPERAEAQAPVLERASATPKGTIGLGLIGAEIGLLVPVLCHLDKTWSLITFPLVGAAGGAIAGYFALDRPDHNGGAVAVLVTGLSLVMPTVISTVAVLRHGRERELTGSAERARRLAMAGPGFVRLVDGRLTFAAPGVGVARSLTRDEQMRYGGVATNELHVALFSGSF